MFLRSTLAKKLLLLFALMFSASFASALFISAAKDPEVFLKQHFPNGSWVIETIQSAADDTLTYWRVTEADETIAYAFETNLVHQIPAYSGEPVNMLVLITPEGEYINAHTLEHHEPILLVGIPESKLDDFTDQYQNLSIEQRIKVGGNSAEGQTQIDGISGATVTVMVMNVGITRGATLLARALGIIETTSTIILPSTVNLEVAPTKTWTELTGEGSIRRLLLRNRQVDEAFKGTKGEGIDQVADSELDDQFTDVYYALADVPAIGKNVLGESEYQWLMDSLEPDEHVLMVLGNGYSYKGSGYVRGGIFDRIQLLQNELAISFRDLDHTRLQDIYLPDAPRFSEMSLFTIREHHGFDPGQPWQFEFLVRRQIGAIDSVFTSFKADYATLDDYLIRPVQPVAEPELELWQQIWLEKKIEIGVLIFGLVVLLGVLFFQDVLVRYPRLLHSIRNGFLIYTVVFIGWYCAGQISIVNVFTFLQAMMKDFSWDIFLLDPIIFIMWIAVAVTGLMWGRGVFCGWLCPFGALQELINHVSRMVKIPQFELPWSVHERLWAIKYLILLALFGLSLQSLALAEQFAEIEPFKTTFLLKFSREWGYVLWAGLILVSNIFSRKTFCRYLCPLGAALSVPTNIKLFDWLKRRPECGSPCRVCANECEIQAIAPDGVINQRECHYCLDCQMTYFDEEKCPPLVLKAKKERKRAIAAGEQIEIIDATA
ncbi:transcriptional regulator NosR [Reinekea sp.]|jgi:NosR/NirI family nitrous oxide reductase transcriptional regulator|uniref:transcriptional regulator NosR n=2 Tax=Reinekea sp. TaxID=1970455 RepID=UPI003989049E